MISSSKSSTKRKHDNGDRDKDVKRSRHEDGKDEKEPKDEKKNGVEIPAVIPEGETVGSKMAVLSADRIKVRCL